MKRLNGKTAVITAAGQGIGLASALLFAKEGARVIAVDINAASLAMLEGMDTRRMDLTDSAAVRALSRDVGDASSYTTGTMHIIDGGWSNT